MKAFLPIALATLGVFGACGGSTDVKPVCGMSGNCGGGGAQGGGSSGGAGAGSGGGSADGSSSCRSGETQACVGPPSCVGIQKCLDDGRGFGACVCVSGGLGGFSGAGGSSGAAGGAFGGGPIDGGALDGPTACQGISLQAELMERDIFLLLDQSASMVDNGSNRWTFVTNAIIDAVLSPPLMGVGLGLGYFGLHPPGSPPADPAAPGSCNPSDYARPDVPINVLPAGGSEITDSLRRRTPGGGTPTQPALQGALQYAVQWAAAHPARKTVIVLATDGAPQGCAVNDVTTVSQIAAAGLARNPSIPTYVIAIGGVQGLDQIAQAGGTSQAFTVDDTNTRQQFLDALKQISGRIVTCEFTLPRYEERPIDFSKVNVHHRPVGGSQSVIYYVDGPGDCSAASGGWYYLREGSGNPVAIKLCPTSCNAVMNGGTLTVIFGCASERPPLQ